MSIQLYKKQKRKMLFAFFSGFFFISLVTIGELAVGANYGNITCETDFNTTNLTDILFSDVIYTDIKPNSWLLLNAACGLSFLLLLAGEYLLKKGQETNKSFCAKLVAYVVYLFVLLQILLIVYALNSYTFSKKICSHIESENFDSLRFNEILYIMYGIIPVEIIVIFVLLNLKNNKKPKEIEETALLKDDFF